MLTRRASANNRARFCRVKSNNKAGTGRVSNTHLNKGYNDTYYTNGNATYVMFK